MDYLYNIMSLKIAKMLVSLKNASKIKQITTDVDFNKNNIFVLTLLYKEGLIQSFSLQKDKNNLITILVSLRYCEGKNVLSSLKLISKPSLSRYFSYSELCFISNKFSFGALSTDKCILSLSDCKKSRIGGQFLFVCV
jgi:small subunit ribosomal protein S8